MSGFQINYDKTTIMRIGSLRNSNQTLIAQKAVSWTNEPINVLGVNVSTNIYEAQSINYDNIMKKVRATMEAWCNRKLSLIGKILIVNTLIASLFVYTLTVLPGLSHKLLQDIKVQIVNFLWNGAKPKIAYDTLTLAKKQGGLKLVDLGIKNASLKISWIQILHNDNKLANVVYKNLNIKICNLIWDCNLKSSDVKWLTTDIFWNEVFATWFQLKQKDERKEEKNQIIWWNSEIRIEDRPFYWDKPYNKGLIYTHQLYENGNLKSCLQICENYEMTLMQLNGLLSALPRHYRLTAHKEISTENSFLNFALAKPNLTRYAYESLLQVKYEEDAKGANIIRKKRVDWQKELNCTITEENFEKGFKELYVVTNTPKLRSFQYRLLHRAVVTNIHLNRWGKLESQNCTFCDKQSESYSHLFIYCEHIEKLWLDTEIFMNLINTEPIQFNQENVIFNRLSPNTKNVKNFICCLLKQFVYMKRCFKQIPTFFEFKELVWKTKNIEKFIAIKNQKQKKHEQKWNMANDSNNEDINIDDIVIEHISNM